MHNVVLVLPLRVGSCGGLIGQYGCLGECTVIGSLRRSLILIAATKDVGRLGGMGIDILVDILGMERGVGLQS
jgi:hypothetical protein